jgi:cob(I)alamin adenosyltransferase
LTNESPETTAPEDDARHAEKMAKKKAARDKIMAGKSGEKGIRSWPARAVRRG